MSKKKLNSRWGRVALRYSETRIIDDEQHGDAVSEITWLARRREPFGWRAGARVARS